MTREPFIAHSELTNEIYIIVGKEKYRVTEQAIKAVVAIKALEQEPCGDLISRQTGHWKRNETIALTYCSECGFGQRIDEYRTYNYCPNCGCRMVEPQESEDKE